MPGPFDFLTNHDAIANSPLTPWASGMAERLPILERIPGPAPLIMVGRLISSHLKPVNARKADNLVAKAILHLEIACTLLRPLVSQQPAVQVAQVLAHQIGMLSAGTAGAAIPMPERTVTRMPPPQLPSFMPPPVLPYAPARGGRNLPYSPAAAGEADAIVAAARPVGALDHGS
jgi:hypothetical protein